MGLKHSFFPFLAQTPHENRYYCVKDVYFLPQTPVIVIKKLLKKVLQVANILVHTVKLILALFNFIASFYIFEYLVHLFFYLLKQFSTTH